MNLCVSSGFCSHLKGFITKIYIVSALIPRNRIFSRMSLVQLVGLTCNRYMINGITKYRNSNKSCGHKFKATNIT